MIQSFRCKRTEALYRGHDVREFRSFREQAERRLQILDKAIGIEDLMMLRSNRFEALKGDRKGQYSIRVNLRWRLCFRWTAEGPEGVEIVDYH
jgi:proteic killer suppression protein